MQMDLLLLSKETKMKQIIHTGFGFEFGCPEILGKINKIKEKDNGLEVDATMDTEKLKKFMEKLDAWERSERDENDEIDSPETQQGLKMRVEILDTSNPYRSQSNYETLSKIKNFCKGHCVLDIKFFKESETSTYVIVVYKD